MTVKIKTRLGVFVFQTNERNLLNNINQRKLLNFVDINGKCVTLFNDVLQTVEITEV